MAKEGEGAVDKLKKRLYTRNKKDGSKSERSALSPSGAAQAPSSWGDVKPTIKEEPASTPAPTPLPALKIPVGFEGAGEIIPAEPVPQQEAPAPVKSRHMTFATKFFFGSFVFFLLAIAAAALLFFGGVNTTSPRNIDIEIIAPSLIDGGKEATLQFIITNRNTTDLELADLVVVYPEGARNSEDPTDTLTHERISIGSIKSGEQVKRTATALFYGQEGAQEKVIARLEYSVAGSNAVFEKEGETSFTIGSAPVSISVEVPERVTAGQDFLMTLTVRSNAATEVENVTIEAQYPFGFSVSGTQPEGTVGGRLWRLGKMEPGTSKTIRIEGSLEASDGDERVFRFLAGSNADTTDTSVKVPFLTVPQTVTVDRPFISGEVSVEGKLGSNIAVAAGERLQGTVEWVNNLSEAVSDVELTLAFSGPALDEDSINSQNGFYQSRSTSLIWTQERDESLALVPPGGKGSYQFSFATLPPGAEGVLITNPTITLNLSIQARREGSSSVVSTVAVTKVTLASQLILTAESFRDSGPFSNGGPVPPRVDEETSYTVTWEVKNSANAVANTVVEAVLPPYVEYKAAQSGSGITYDSSSRTVRWQLGDVKAGAGFTSDSRSASFQVALTPSSSQVGSTPALTGVTTISGQDRFAQVQLEGSVSGPTTSTSDGENGAVAP